MWIQLKMDCQVGRIAANDTPSGFKKEPDRRPRAGLISNTLHNQTIQGSK